MFCPKCGAPLPEYSNFCPSCGAACAQDQNTQNQNTQNQNGQYYNNAYQNPNGPYQQPMNSSWYRAPIQKRNIALCIVLSLITCGIYMYYWLYCIAEDLNTASHTQEATGGMVVLLSIVTCGIYLWYWLYKAGEKVDAIRVRCGMAAANSSVVYLLLGIFGLSIISQALIQNELNAVATQ